MIMKSRVTWACLPALILSANACGSSRTCTASVPNSEFCLRPVLSSMMTADTPARSRVLTVYLKCSMRPPVSPSTMIGLVETSMISSMVSMRLDQSTSSMSGLPLKDESHRLLTQNASYSRTLIVFSSTDFTFSTINADRPLETSIARM